MLENSTKIVIRDVERPFHIFWSILVFQKVVQEAPKKVSGVVARR
jgi:hypothetical protein